MSKKQTLLQLAGVDKVFTQGSEKIHALSGANFEALAGEMVAVIGPSGSGKSTLLTVGGALQTPTKGQVIIAGIDIADLSKKQLSNVRLKHIGFILQASNLVPFLTVNQQLELVSKVTGERFRETARTELFRDLGITKLRHKYPRDLSGGERQRVAIAKILHSNPDVILADEPTASLDTKRAFEVMELLKRVTLERNKATIVVTHDERLLKYCDKVYEMRDGIIKKKR